MIDRLLAAGSDLLLAGPLFFRFLSRSVQYSFRRILLLLLLKFHSGIYVTGSAPERAPVCGVHACGISMGLSHFIIWLAPQIVLLVEAPES